MPILSKFFRKLFLVKEIKSKEGVVHFRRYRLFQSPIFAIYIHNIMKSDEDRHKHDHPWNFVSIILEGAYEEEFTQPPYHFTETHKVYMSGDFVHHPAEDAHKLTLISDNVITLVFAYGKRRVWGYQTEKGWIDFKTYRQAKNEGKL